MSEIGNKSGIELFIESLVEILPNLTGFIPFAIITAALIAFYLPKKSDKNKAFDSVFFSLTQYKLSVINYSNKPHESNFTKVENNFENLENDIDSLKGYITNMGKSELFLENVLNSLEMCKVIAPQIKFSEDKNHISIDKFSHNIKSLKIEIKKLRDK